MEITKDLKQGTYNVVLSGQFTFNDHLEFRDILGHFAEQNVRQVVLDMSGVEFVDSAALGMLLLALDESEKHQKSVVISGAVGQVKKMFDMAKFNTLFAMN